MQSPLPFPKPPSSGKLSIKHLQGGRKCDEGRETEAKTHVHAQARLLSPGVVPMSTCVSVAGFGGHGLHIPGNTKEYCILHNFSLEDAKQHSFYGMLAHSSPLFLIWQTGACQLVPGNAALA